MLSGPAPRELALFRSRFVFDVQDLDVGHEGVAGFDEAPQDDGLDPALAAGLETRVRVDELDVLLAGLLRAGPATAPRSPRS